MIKNLFNSILGSPLDPNQRAAMFANDDVSLRRKIVEYEKRMHEMNEIANRQAKDISELRHATETSIEASVAAQTAALASGESTVMRTPAAPADRRGSDRWRTALEEATAQQQQAITRGQEELRELAGMLQSSYESQSRRQAEEWKGVLTQTNETHREAVTQLQAQLQSVVDERRALSEAVSSRQENSGGDGAARFDAAARAKLLAAHRAVASMRSEHALLAGSVRTALASGARAVADEAGAAVGARLAAADAAVSEMAAARRAATDKLQELQGSIRVLVRCRPLSSAELASREGGAVAVASRTALSLTDAGDGASRAVGGGAAPATHDFSFDAALDHTCDAARVYEEVSPAVASVLQGQYVCVMAYGQTGAGKTFTMQGSGASQPGVVRLAADELWREAAAMQAARRRQGQTLHVSFEVSMLEIYNEKVVDLLAPPPASTPTSTHAADGASSSSSLELRVGSDGGVSVQGLTLEKLDATAASGADGVSALLARGAARRHTHATLMNLGSSRSHLVLTVHAALRSEPEGLAWRGKLHLVDLAGSERVGKSGVVGEQLREAQCINKSLSQLEQVMLALQQRQKDKDGKDGGGSGSSASSTSSTHVPYRNSKLTLLLSDALGAKGSCAKTIMLLNVSPAASSAPETLRTLRFGERCAAVCLGSVRKVARRVDKHAEKAERAEVAARKLSAQLEAARAEAAEARRAMHDGQSAERAAAERAKEGAAKEVAERAAAAEARVEAREAAAAEREAAAEAREAEAAARARGAEAREAAAKEEAAELRRQVEAMQEELRDQLRAEAEAGERVKSAWAAEPTESDVFAANALEVLEAAEEEEAEAEAAVEATVEEEAEAAAEEEAAAAAEEEEEEEEKRPPPREAVPPLPRPALGHLRPTAQPGSPSPMGKAKESPADVDAAAFAVFAPPTAAALPRPDAIPRPGAIQIPAEETSEEEEASEGTQQQQQTPRRASHPPPPNTSAPSTPTSVASKDGRRTSVLAPPGSIGKSLRTEKSSDNLFACEVAARRVAVAKQHQTHNGNGGARRPSLAWGDHRPPARVPDRVHTTPRQALDAPRRVTRGKATEGGGGGGGGGGGDTAARAAARQSHAMTLRAKEGSGGGGHLSGAQTARPWHAGAGAEPREPRPSMAAQQANRPHSARSRPSEVVPGRWR